MDMRESLSIFTVDDKFMNQWFDSFHPSIKTFVTDFVINKLKHCDYDPDAIEDCSERCFANLLVNHFATFLELKVMDENPGRLLKGWMTLPSP